jgi:hypothetical protein
MMSSPIQNLIWSFVFHLMLSLKLFARLAKLCTRTQNWEHAHQTRTYTQNIGELIKVFPIQVQV